jgi:arylsulfatase A-like enzyme
MPFLVRWPGIVEAGGTSDQLVSFVDVLATFADLVDVELPAEAGPDSFSMLSALLGKESTSARTSLAIRSAGGTMVYRKGPWKLVTELGSGGFSKPKRVKPEKDGPTGQLYNLDSDLGETRNLFSEKPALVEELSRELALLRDSDQSRP